MSQHASGCILNRGLGKVPGLDWVGSKSEAPGSLLVVCALTQNGFVFLAASFSLAQSSLFTGISIFAKWVRLVIFNFAGIFETTTCGKVGYCGTSGGVAECNSAIQESAALRYEKVVSPGVIGGGLVSLGVHLPLFPPLKRP